MEENPLIAKTLDFSVRIVNLYKCLRDERHETVMSKSPSQRHLYWSKCKRGNSSRIYG